jgi:hypothetical protein
MDSWPAGSKLVQTKFVTDVTFATAVDRPTSEPKLAEVEFADPAVRENLDKFRRSPFLRRLSGTVRPSRWEKSNE